MSLSFFDRWTFSEGVLVISCYLTAIKTRGNTFPKKTSRADFKCPDLMFKKLPSVDDDICVSF
jgi:hypothetical protein